jgi:hypothetical protein
MREAKHPMYRKKHSEDMAFELKHGVRGDISKDVIIEFLVKVFRDDRPSFDEARFRRAIEDE